MQPLFKQTKPVVQPTEQKRPDEKLQQHCKTLQELNVDDDRASAVTHVSQRLSQLGQDWRQNQRRLNSSTSQITPDEWIDRYAAGLLKPNVNASSRSSVKTELKIYSGKSLDWFEWIDLYRARVHDTGKSAGEKLAILKRYLKGDCLDLVQGLGGGEPAYIEALVRLKQSWGRRNVMQAATLQAIEKVELKNDPFIFKRFVERIRTHLFDLSRIGESNVPDLIENICMRLQPPDRL